MNGDKNLFFFILSLCCFWLVLDQIVGNKNISNFVDKLGISQVSTTVQRNDNTGIPSYDDTTKKVNETNKEIKDDLLKYDKTDNTYKLLSKSQIDQLAQWTNIPFPTAISEKGIIEQIDKHISWSSPVKIYMKDWLFANWEKQGKLKIDKEKDYGKKEYK